MYDMIGNTYIFAVGPATFRFTFDSETQATFTIVDGGGMGPDGHTETVAIQLVELRPGLFVNNWTESTGATVTHIEDFENGTILSNYNLGGTMYILNGTIAPADTDAESDSVATA